MLWGGVIGEIRERDTPGCALEPRQRANGSIYLALGVLYPFHIFRLLHRNMADKVRFRRVKTLDILGFL